MKKVSKHLIGILLCTLGLLVNANNLNITNVSLTGATSTTIQVEYNMFWDNSWRDAENYDAVWVFIKYTTNSGSSWSHATLSSTGHVSGTATPTPTIQIPLDNLGAFVYRSAAGTGTYNITGQQLRWNFSLDGLTQTQAAAAEVRVMGFEVVFVPQGPFALGDGVNYSGAPAPSSNSFRRNFTNRAVYITNSISDSINDPISGLFFRIDGMNGVDLNNDGVVGIWPTDVPEFPIGFRSFYCMKYEITQGQYVDFLNTLTYAMQTTRVTNATNVVGQNVVDALTATLPSHRCNIFVQVAGSSPSLARVYTATRPDRACNYLNWPDVAAYLDWCGFRPMTEFEWEKVARGPLPPVQGEFAWGNASATRLTVISTGSENGQETATSTLQNVHQMYTSSVTGGDGSFTSAPVRVGMFARANTTRAQSGLSFYGVADMTGNVCEYVVGFHQLSGRSYTGVHGNGRLISATGDADVNFWPGINTNQTVTTANTAFGGSTGVTRAAGIQWKEDGNCFIDCTTLYPVSYRVNWASTSTTYHTTRHATRGGRGVKSNL
jgi:formylglycine-generating enzyme required for sulfatase activity